MKGVEQRPEQLGTPSRKLGGRINPADLLIVQKAMAAGVPLAAFPFEERRVVESRYFVPKDEEDQKPASLEALAAEFNKTPEGIRKVESRALRKLGGWVRGFISTEELGLSGRRGRPKKSLEMPIEGLVKRRPGRPREDLQLQQEDSI